MSRKRKAPPLRPVEYIFENSPWKVEDSLSLQDEIGVEAKHLADFHGLVGRNLSVAFDVARMIYGIAPVIPNQDSDPDLLRRFSRDEVASKMGTTVDGVNGQLEILATAWRRHIEGSSKEPARPQPAQPPVSASLALVSGDEDALLIQYGFSKAIFEVPGRDPGQREAEVKWFTGRLAELRKMFEEPMAKSLARQALLNEMILRRCDDEMTNIPVSSGKFGAIQSLKERIEDTYREQWSQLEEICPFIKNVVGKQTFAGVMSDVVEAWKRYKANGDNSLIDGVFTAFEIAIEMRHSVQAEVRYRPGLVAAINEAKQGLWDPKWRRKLPNSVIAAMDSGFRAAFHQAVEEKGLPVVDLEKDGPAGEYPDLPEPTPFDEAIPLPEDNVQLEDSK